MYVFPNFCAYSRTPPSTHKVSVVYYRTLSSIALHLHPFKCPLNDLGHSFPNHCIHPPPPKWPLSSTSLLYSLPNLYVHWRTPSWTHKTSFVYYWTPVTINESMCPLMDSTVHPQDFFRLLPDFFVHWKDSCNHWRTPLSIYMTSDVHSWNFVSTQRASVF